MIRKMVTVTNSSGIHARPASLLVKLAGKFESDFYIHAYGYRINAKSILGVLTLAAECGAELELELDGPDEIQAMNEILGLFKRNFDMEDE